MNTTQPKVQVIEIGGYKLPQYQLHLKNTLGEFFLFPVLPSPEYLLARVAPAYKDKLARVLDKPQKGYSIPPYESLFARSRMLTLGEGQDSFFNLVEDRLRLYKKEYETAKFDVPDQLQVLFESDRASFEEVYLAAVRTLSREPEFVEDEGFLDAIDNVIRGFTDMLREDGRTGTGEIRLVEQLYRRQVMFGNRILMLDMPLFIRQEDIEIDKIFTSLLALGWSYEFDAKYYRRSNEDIRDLTKRFLRLYLTALTAKVLTAQDDNATKYQKRKNRSKGGLELEDLTIEHDDGSVSQTYLLQSALSDTSGEEALLARDEVERLLPLLTEREREIATLISEGNTNTEVAKQLSISPAAVGQALKRIRERLR